MLLVLRWFSYFLKRFSFLKRFLSLFSLNVSRAELTRDKGAGRRTDTINKRPIFYITRNVKVHLFIGDLITVQYWIIITTTRNLQEKYKIPPAKFITRYPFSRKKLSFPWDSNTETSAFHSEANSLTTALSSAWRSRYLNEIIHVSIKYVFKPVAPFLCILDGFWFFLNPDEQNYRWRTLPVRHWGKKWNDLLCEQINSSIIALFVNKYPHDLCFCEINGHFSATLSVDYCKDKSKYLIS